MNPLDPTDAAFWAKTPAQIRLEQLQYEWAAHREAMERAIEWAEVNDLLPKNGLAIWDDFIADFEGDFNWQAGD